MCFCQVAQFGRFSALPDVKAPLCLGNAVPNAIQSQASREEPEQSGCQRAAAMMDGPH